MAEALIKNDDIEIGCTGEGCNVISVKCDVNAGMLCDPDQVMQEEMVVVEAIEKNDSFEPDPTVPATQIPTTVPPATTLPPTTTVPPTTTTTTTTSTTTEAEPEPTTVPPTDLPEISVEP